MLINQAISPLMGKAPGCPELEMERAYLFATIDFCKRTRVMLSWVITTSDALLTPTITLDQQVTEIIDATINGEDLTIAKLNDRRVLNATVDKPVLTWSNANVPILMPTDVPAGTELQMLLVFAPGPTTTDIEDTIYLAHQEALEHGTLARLLAQPRQQWTDQATAGYYAGLFEAAVKDARSKQSQNMSMAAIRPRTKIGVL
jgi:hypothetical protein